MFSRTILGRLVDQIHQKKPNPDQVFTVINLLLADAELYRDKQTLTRINQWLQLIYSRTGKLRFTEVAPSIDVQTSVREALDDQDIRSSPLAAAYLSGLLGVPIGKIFSDQSVRSGSIYKRQLRIFHCYKPGFVPNNSGITPIGLVGLKGSGKSALLQALEKRGETTHEIYRHLDLARNTKSDLVSTLPPASEWEAEPLSVSLRSRGWGNNWPRRFFVGSLLRLSEIELLHSIGRPLLVYVEAPNKLRHERVKNRGRAIEFEARESWLTELDAHRSGEWPGYERNDVSSLIRLADYTVHNDECTNIDTLANQVLEHILEHDLGGE